MYEAKRDNLLGSRDGGDSGVLELVINVIIITITVILMSVLCVKTFWFTPFNISGTSMEPTIQNGDWVLADKLASPKLSDVVIVFNSHKSSDNEIIKRVVGMPKDTVYYDKNGYLYEVETDSDGKALTTMSGKTLYRLKKDDYGYFAANKPEYYLSLTRVKVEDIGSDVIVRAGEYSGKIGRIKSIRGDTVACVEMAISGEVVSAEIECKYFWVLKEDKIIIKNLAADEYFVFGDNRDVSSDSRRYGAFKTDEIIGVVHKWIIDNRKSSGWVYKYL